MHKPARAVAALTLAAFCSAALAQYPNELAAFLKDQIDSWGRTARAVGINPE